VSVLQNPSQSVAFFVKLKVTKGKGGDEILPDSLLPGEKREISASYRTSALGTSTANVEVQGWNVEAAN
jgi:hypothetical protein